MPQKIEFLNLLMSFCLVFISCQVEMSRPGRKSPSAESGEAFISPLPRSDIYQRIKAAVDSIRIIDTHEHLVTEKLWLAQTVDLFYWFKQPWFYGYTEPDLLSAGMPLDDLNFLGDLSKSPEERWARLAPYWAFTKYTCFGQALRIAAREIHGVPDIDDSNWKKLSDSIAASKKPGFFEKLLHEKAGIDLMILDQIVLVDSSLSEGPPPHTVRVKRFDDNFIRLDRADLKEIKALYGIEVHTLDDVLAAIDKVFQKILDSKYYVGLKCAVAYDRSLRFEDTPRPEAERLFAELLKRDLAPGERKPLEDFIMHQVLSRAAKHRLPVQIHTGLQVGPGNNITNSNPTLLINLFEKYPEIKFDLFHGSFPYLGEMAVLAKNFPNVYLDMTWLPIISPTEAREWLGKWIETVPVNKINVFGGDYLFPEGAYGHSVLARQIVTEALAAKVEAGYLTESEAVWIARRILRENAIELFGLKRFL